MDTNTNRLRALRESKGIGSGEFAKMLGVRGDYYSSIENGRSKLAPKLARKAAEVLGCEVVDLRAREPAADTGRQENHSDEDRLLALYRMLDESKKRATRAVVMAFLQE